MTDDVPTNVVGSRRRSPSGVRDLVPGELIDGWRIVRILGGGGFGTVYEVRHDRTERRAALKLLHAHFTTSSEMLARFDREIGVLRRLTHPHVVNFIGAGFSADQRPYLCMELLDGVELDKIVKAAGPLDLDRTLSILGALCDALGRAHELGIVHRDIKASNVMVCSSPAGQPERVVLLDFGIAKISDALAPELTESRQSLGTPSCMAPEQIHGLRVDARTDIYALGGLLFHMLTGRLPFEDTSATMVQYLHLHARRPMPSAVVPVSRELDEVIACAMAIEPSARYAAAGSLLAAARSAGRARSTPQKTGNIPCIALLVSTSSEGLPLDARLLEDFEGVLPAAERWLTPQGFQLVADLGTSALFVAAADTVPDPVGMATALLDRLARRPRCDARIRIGVGVHRESATFIGTDIQPGPLLQPATWNLPERIEGVWVTGKLDPTSPSGRRVHS